MYKLIRETQGFTPLDNKHLTGFTLTELLIATLLLSVIALGVTSINVSSRQFLISARNQAKALNEARFAMEHMLRIMRGGSAALPTGADDNKRVFAEDPVYGWTWKDYRLGAGANSTKIRFRPDYPSSSGEEYIADNITNLSFSDVFTGSGGLKYFTITITADVRGETVTLISNVTLRNS